MFTFGSKCAVKKGLYRNILLVYGVWRSWKSAFPKSTLLFFLHIFGRITCVHSWKYSLWLFLFDYTVIYSKFMEGDEGERVCFLRWLPIFPQLHIFGRNFTGVHLWKCSLWLYLVWITKLLRELSKETLTHFCQWAFKQKIRQNNINVYEKAKKGWDLSFHSIRKIYINSIPEKAVCICTIQLTVVNCDKKRLFVTV